MGLLLFDISFSILLVLFELCSTELDLVSIEGEYTVSYCQRAYGNLSYFSYKPDDIIIVPPVLISAPGSGSFWVRSLLEYGTGLYSGSIELDNPQQELQYFPRATMCDIRLCVLNCEDAGKYIYYSRKGEIALNQRWGRRKCRRGIVHKITRVIFLARNPYDAMLVAIYNNARTAQAKLDFMQRAIKLAAKYPDLWETITPFLQFLGTGYGRLLIVRYEDLVNPKTRMKVLMDAATFALRSPVSRQRIECAFQLAEPLAARDRVPSTLSLGGQGESAAWQSEEQIERLWVYVANYASNMSYSKPTIASTVTVMTPSNSPSFQQERGQQHGLAQGQYVTSKLRKFIDCASRFGGRQFASTHALGGQNAPPLLLSYPGSGNTWCRLLLEYSTGMFSGSIDLSDTDLGIDFLGERFCGLSQSAIKAHPINVMFNRTLAALLNASRYEGQPLGAGVELELVDALHRRKCGRGGIGGFNKVIFLTRDPFAAILAEFQRSVNMNHYAALDTREFSSLSKLWHASAEKAAREYRITWEKVLYPAFTALPPGNVLWVKYERLLDKRERGWGQVRLAELSRVAAFIRPELRDTSESLDHQWKQQQQQQGNVDCVRCAFLLAETPKVRRLKSNMSVTPAFAYRNDTLVQFMWEQLKYFSSNFSYSRFKAQMG